MSFTSEFREEILTKRFNSSDENLAFISGVTAVSGALKVDEKKRYSIEVISDSYDLTAAVNDALFSVYGGNYEVNIRTLENNEKEFSISLGGDNFPQIASDIGYISIKNGNLIPNSGGIGIRLVSDKDIKAYIIGVVSVLATVVVPLKTGDSYSGGYHFEMLFSDERLADDIARLLLKYNIVLKKVLRGDEYGLYIKDSEIISDMLAFVGANNAVLELNNIIGIKELRNNVNRQQNCSIANIDKAINASQKQIAAIQKIDKAIGINSMPEKLREIALMRINNPSLTLDELAELTEGRISKSGINHRFRKIIEFADAIPSVDALDNEKSINAKSNNEKEEE